MTKVSIILPVYNAEKYLAATLDSVLKQDFDEFELICVNDGSSDKSVDILKRYNVVDSRMKIINQANKGGSAARNAGIKHAVGDYIMFIDSDDIYASHIVSEAYERAIKTDVDIVLYNFARFVGKPTFLSVKSKTTPGEDIEVFTKKDQSDRFFNNFATITWNKLIKRTLIVKKHLLFNETLSHNHDVDFSIRLMLEAESYSWLNKVGYYYRSNEAGLTATKRDDPTNVLKILMKLSKLFKSENTVLKQSFDNYVVDMIIGTIEKYKNNKSKQEEVFMFAQREIITDLGLDIVKDEYIVSQNVYLFRVLRDGVFYQYEKNVNTLSRKIRTVFRRLYDKAQLIISRIAV